MSITLEISDELANKIKAEAKIRGIAIEDYLKSIIQKEVTLTERQKIEEDQNWWLNLPLSKRAKYEGEYVAIHNKTLIDHDSDREALHRRIRSKYGKEAILMYALTLVKGYEKYLFIKLTSSSTQSGYQM